MLQLVAVKIFFHLHTSASSCRKFVKNSITFDGLVMCRCQYMAKDVNQEFPCIQLTACFKRQIKMLVMVRETRNPFQISYL